MYCMFALSLLFPPFDLVLRQHLQLFELHKCIQLNTFHNAFYFWKFVSILNYFVSQTVGVQLCIDLMFVADTFLSPKQAECASARSAG